MKNNYIGIFDSGIGGLTVYKKLKEMMPNENIVYFGDTKNAPYGDKEPQELKKLVNDNIKFLETFKPKAIAVGCNTADSIAIDNINSDVPIIRIIESTCIQAIKTTKNNNIGIIATNAAINSHAYENTIYKLNKNINVYSISCPKLVPLIEKGIFTGKQMQDVLHQYLDFFIDKNIDTLILGCTHYPLVSKEITKLLPNVTQISSSDCLANNIKDYLINNDELSDKYINDIFYTSGDVKTFEDNASLFINNIKANKKSTEM